MNDYGSVVMTIIITGYTGTGLFCHEVMVVGGRECKLSLKATALPVVVILTVTNMSGELIKI